MIRLGRHLSEQSRRNLVELVVTTLLRDRSVRKLSKKFNIAEDTIYAIKRGLLFGTAGYARQVYKGQKLANYIFKDLRGVKGKAKRTLEEAYLLVGGNPVVPGSVDLAEMSTLSDNAYELRKKGRSKLSTDKALLDKLNKINNKGKALVEENIITLEKNAIIVPEKEAVIAPKKEIVQLQELTFSVNGARVTIKSAGGTIIIDF